MQKDLFSTQHNAYAQFRPEYPQVLYDFLLEQEPTRQRIWDCATGNGQAAKVLCQHFDQVYATDISEKQLGLAFQADNIHYSLQPAEKTNFPDQYFDAITVAQALHWFQFGPFFEEVKRVTKPGALFAAWGYETLRFDVEAIDEQFYHFYREVTGPYWEPERKHIEDRYARVPFPFEPITCPDFEIALEWQLYELEGYLNSWSAVQKCIRLTGNNPVPAFIENIKRYWPQDAVLPVHFPVFMWAGQV
jgi:SAM-dependent methyltransferase